MVHCCQNNFDLVPMLCHVTSASHVPLLVGHCIWFVLSAWLCALAGFENLGRVMRTAAACYGALLCLFSVLGKGMVFSFVHTIFEIYLENNSIKNSKPTV